MSLEALFIEIFEKYRSNNNVFAIDIGNRFVDEKRTDEHCVRMHMQGDLPAESKPSQAEVQLLNYRIASTDQVGSFSSDPKRKVGRRTIQPGLSIGGVLSSRRGTAGTIGLIGYDKLQSNQLSLITCHHVVPSKAKILVTQPGTSLDRGDRRIHVVGRLSRFDPQGDAALIHLFGRRNNPARTRILTDFKIFQTGDKINAIRRPRLGDILTKSGRTSGVTEAIVDGIGYYLKSRGRGQPRVAIPAFRLVPVDPANSAKVEISMNGDSGSIWYDKTTREGVGLLFAGEERKIPHSMEFSWAQQLTDVFERLRFSLSP